MSGPVHAPPHAHDGEAMKSANATFGGTPSKQPAEQRPAGESPARLPQDARARTELERAGWGRCEESTRPPAPAAAGHPPEEPQTGVVRTLDDPERQSGLIARPRSRPSSGRMRAARLLAEQTGDNSGEWRCLEWDQGQRGRRPKRNSKVTIVQLTWDGDLIRQNGPDSWLPEAGDFVHRMARLLAQGLGFERCRSLCLRSSSAALAVAEAGDTKVVAVSGPSPSMTNVLRRAGLE
jgi:hypothetical protein